MPSLTPTQSQAYAASLGLWRSLPQPSVSMGLGRLLGLSRPQPPAQAPQPSSGWVLGLCRLLGLLRAVLGAGLAPVLDAPTVVPPADDLQQVRGEDEGMGGGEGGPCSTRTADHPQQVGRRGHSSMQQQQGGGRGVQQCPSRTVLRSHHCRTLPPAPASCPRTLHAPCPAPALSGPHTPRPLPCSRPEWSTHSMPPALLPP